VFSVIYLLFNFSIKLDKITQIGETKIDNRCSCYFPELLLSLWSELHVIEVAKIIILLAAKKLT
jgi:hypothetical protein